jgi:hypothetical protein
MTRRYRCRQAEKSSVNRGAELGRVDERWARRLGCASQCSALGWNARRSRRPTKLCVTRGAGSPRANLTGWRPLQLSCRPGPCWRLCISLSASPGPWHWPRRVSASCSISTSLTGGRRPWNPPYVKRGQANSAAVAHVLDSLDSVTMELSGLVPPHSQCSINIVSFNWYLITLNAGKERHSPQARDQRHNSMPKCRLNFMQGPVGITAKMPFHAGARSSPAS